MSIKKIVKVRRNAINTDIAICIPAELKKNIPNIESVEYLECTITNGNIIYTPMVMPGSGSQ